MNHDNVACLFPPVFYPVIISSMFLKRTNKFKNVPFLLFDLFPLKYTKMYKFDAMVNFYFDLYFYTKNEIRKLLKQAVSSAIWSLSSSRNCRLLRASCETNV